MEMRSSSYAAQRVTTRLFTPLALAALLTVPFGATAQEKPERCDRGHGHAVLATSFDEGYGEQTLRQLETVHRSDSLYDRVLLRRFQIMMEKDQNDEVLSLCAKGIAKEDKMMGTTMLLRAAVFIDVERWDEAVHAADSAIAYMPGLFRPRHLKAVALGGAGNKKASLEQALDNARRFPYSQDAHILLGTIAFNEGHTAEAALALAMAQIVRFDDTMAENLLTFNDAMLGGRSTMEPEGYDLKATGDQLEEVEALLKNKVAMNKNYKVKPDLEYPMCRQSHLVFSAVQQMKGEGTGAYTALYSPLITAIMDEGLFEGYVYHCLNSSSDKKVRSIATKNKSKVEAFRTRLPDLFEAHYLTFADPASGAEVVHYYYNSGDLKAHGQGDAVKGTATGTWTYYHTNGVKSAQGTLSEGSDRQGTWWNWYDNGALQSRAEFVDDEMNGTFLIYHKNGSLMDSSFVKDGTPIGETCTYYYMGGTRTRKITDGETLNGPVEEMHPSGAVEWTYTMVKGKAHGTGRQLYANGALRYEGEYVNDERQGLHTTMHSNGNKHKVYTYVDGNLNGPFQEWHANGQLAAEGAMKAGNLTGEAKNYDEWGTLTLVRRYDDQGRLQGVRESYNNDGTRYMDMEYNKDLLIRYKYYDRTGKVLGEGTRSKGKFNFKGYHPDGGVSVEGTYLDEGSKEGEWKYYFEDGSLDTQENFKNGELSGEQLHYRADGTVLAEYDAYERNGIHYRAFKRFYPSGNVRQSGAQKGTATEGEFRRYYPDGTLETSEYYVDDSRDGWQDFLDPAGKLLYSELIMDKAYVERINYDDDGNEYEHIRVQPGKSEMVQHYPGGAVMARFPILNGFFHGTTTWYYPDGSIELQGENVNGDREGKWTRFHPNGKKAYEREYTMGTLTGTERRWYYDGELHMETPYKDGMKHGTVKEYDMRGKISQTEEFEYGEYHGSRINYTHDGKPQMVRFYFKDRLVGYGSPAADGTVKDTVALGAGLVHLETRFPDGTLARKMSYRNGGIDGEFTEYHANGKLMKRVNYRGGSIDGASTEYFSTGQEHIVIPYVDDRKHGEQRIYWEDGKLREQLTWLNGEQQGPHMVYDRSGKKLVTYRMRSDDVQEIIR